MPEPYPFPELPTESFRPDPTMEVICLYRRGDVEILITPPCRESNFISFVFRGNQEISRFALVVDDAGEVVPIWEDGKVTTLDEITALVIRAAIGSEDYEKFKPAAAV
jgi:hypothetical protein